MSLDPPETSGTGRSGISATESVYGLLRRRIVTGSYPPGHRLKEEHVAQETGFSRTPVRAALQRLVNDGLLIGQGRRGAIVAEWTRHDLEEVFDLRILVESHAAGLAARNATPEQLAELEQLAEEMDRLGTEKPNEYLRDLQLANNRFHRLLLQSAGSPRLTKMAEALVDAPLIIGLFYGYGEAELRRSRQHHRDLLLAIRQRDPVLAEQVMRTHLRIARIAFRATSDSTSPENAP
jgi:DNA-binding GntR family transcriptional regulator